MNKNIKGVIVVAILLIGGYCVYIKMSVTKDEKIDYLIKNNYSGSTPAALNDMQDAFIDEWYSGAKNKQATFVFNNKSYHTAGATAVV